ncbi:unnamed protein product [Nezara viridula]|uniref:COX assembly mitochondrial protein n=1 Tax=Nezara viridula TaxID=85310 RepID=A0A9P0MUU7_NEZVI|nr:unnamed protein product [Nezara viridula]
MHPDLSSHLHSDECNLLIQKLLDCRKENKIGHWFGKCTDIDFELNKCLKREREEKRKRNAESALKRREKLVIKS